MRRPRRTNALHLLHAHRLLLLLRRRLAHLQGLLRLNRRLWCPLLQLLRRCCLLGQLCDVAGLHQRCTTVGDRLLNDDLVLDLHLLGCRRRLTGVLRLLSGNDLSSLTRRHIGALYLYDVGGYWLRVLLLLHCVLDLLGLLW